jgi:hypothetical protein
MVHWKSSGKSSGIPPYVHQRSTGFFHWSIQWATGLPVDPFPVEFHWMSTGPQIWQGKNLYWTQLDIQWSKFEKFSSQNPLKVHWISSRSTQNPLYFHWNPAEQMGECKVLQRAVFRTATLSDTHPLRSLMPEEFRGGAKPHLGAACHLHRRRQGTVQDAISQTVRSLGKLTQDFEPCANEASPGSRMMDLYRAQVHFNWYDSYGEEPLKRRRTELNTLFNAVSVAPHTVWMGTDASVPKTTWHHATAAFVFEGLVDLQGSSIMMAGHVLASDVELFAIRAAVCKATGFANCDRIVLFTDSIGMAKRVVDPSIHSGQAHSLAVCKALNTWLSVSPDRRVDFVETPSKLKWGIQHAAHLRARSLPPVPAGVRPDTSLDSIRKEVTNSTIDSWATMSTKDDYLGHQFLILRDPKGKRLRPTYSNGGMWLRNVNEDNALCARFCRAILNHAPTGQYYRRFNIPGHETHECECGCPMQSRHHIFTQCGVLETRDRDPWYIRELVGFLDENPKAFSFGFMFNPPPRDGEG